MYQNSMFVLDRAVALLLFAFDPFDARAQYLHRSMNSMKFQNGMNFFVSSKAFLNSF